MARLKTAVLVSGRGSNLQALLDAGQMSFVDAQTLVVEACSAILGDEAAAQYKRQQDRIMLHSHTPRAPVYPGG